MAEIIPADTHVPGDAGHTTDHDNMSDVLTRLAITLAQASAPGTTFVFGAPGGAAALTALQGMTSGFWPMGDFLNVRAAPYLAAGNGITNDTTALSSAINDLNAGKGGGIFLPSGNYLISNPLPAITRTAATLLGQGYADATGTAGSCITATTGTWTTGAMVTLAGDGDICANVELNGANLPPTILSVSATDVHIAGIQTHFTGPAGTNLDVVTGGNSVWIDSCRINGNNGASIGIQINANDAILTNNKPVNNAIGINLLSGASGALVTGNHITPGANNGQNAVWVQGAGRVAITGNRFDNYVRAGVQLTPTGAGGNSVVITGNVFYSVVQSDNLYPLVSVDTTSAGVHGLVISSNTSYNNGTNRPSYFLHALTQAGAAAASPANLASYGAMVSANVAWCATGFYGPSATPTASRGNLLTTNGTSYSAVTDI